MTDEKNRHTDENPGPGPEPGESNARAVRNPDQPVERDPSHPGHPNHDARATGKQSTPATGAGAGAEHVKPPREK